MNGTHATPMKSAMTRPCPGVAASLATLALLAAGLCAMSGCRQAPADSTSGIVASVGETVITAEDLLRELERRRAALQPILSRDAVLEEMIREEVLVQRARAAGLERDPELQRAYRNQLIGRLRERELTPRLEEAGVTPEQIEARYLEELDRYTRPAKVRLAVLQVPLDAKADAADRARARLRLEAARDQASTLPEGTRGFGPLAITHSDDQVTRYKGGDIGWLDVQRGHYLLPSAVIEAGFALDQPRDLSPVIDTDSGCFLVMKLDARPASATPLDQVAEAIRLRLLAEQRQSMEHSYWATARDAAQVVVHRDQLDAVPVPAESLARSRQAAPPAFP